MSNPSQLEVAEQKLSSAEQKLAAAEGKLETAKQELLHAQQSNNQLLINIAINQLAVAQSGCTVAAEAVSTCQSIVTTLTSKYNAELQQTIPKVVIKSSSPVKPANPNVTKFWNCLKTL